MHFRAKIFTLLTSLMIVAAAPAIAGSVFNTPSSLLYAQNTNFNGAFSSQNDTNGLGNFATVYDNFTLATGANIDTVEWVGSYFNPPQQGPITAWTVSFWADNAGQPGGLIQSFNIAGNGSETFLQNDNVGDPTYLYTEAVNFNAAAGTQYWLSVVPDLGFPPQWGWEIGTGGDSSSYQDFFGTRSHLGNDLSFAVFGTSASVPEPLSLGLMGAGLAALGLAKVRRGRA